MLSCLGSDPPVAKCRDCLLSGTVHYVMEPTPDNRKTTPDVMETTPDNMEINRLDVQLAISSIPILQGSPNFSHLMLLYRTGVIAKILSYVGRYTGHLCITQEAMLRHGEVVRFTPDFNGSFQTIQNNRQ